MAEQELTRSVSQDEIRIAVEKFEKKKPALLEDVTNKFNACVMKLLNNLNKIFPGDQTLLTLISATRKKINDVVVDHRQDPGLFLYDALQNCQSETQQCIFDRLLLKDEVALTKTCSKLSLFNALGIADKWPRLSPNNKEITWSLIQNMIKCSTLLVQIKYGDPYQIVSKTLEFQKAPGTQSLQKLQDVVSMVNIKRDEDAKLRSLNL